MKRIASLFLLLLAAPLPAAQQNNAWRPVHTIMEPVCQATDWNQTDALNAYVGAREFEYKGQTYKGIPGSPCGCDPLAWGQIVTYHALNHTAQSRSDILVHHVGTEDEVHLLGCYPCIVHCVTRSRGGQVLQPFGRDHAPLVDTCTGYNPFIAGIQEVFQHRIGHDLGGAGTASSYNSHTLSIIKTAQKYTFCRKIQKSPRLPSATGIIRLVSLFWN